MAYTGSYTNQSGITYNLTGFNDGTFGRTYNFSSSSGGTVYTQLGSYSQMMSSIAQYAGSAADFQDYVGNLGFIKDESTGIGTYLFPDENPTPETPVQADALFQTPEEQAAYNATQSGGSQGGSQTGTGGGSFEQQAQSMIDQALNDIANISGNNQGTEWQIINQNNLTNQTASLVQEGLNSLNNVQNQLQAQATLDTQMSQVAQGQVSQGNDIDINQRMQSLLQGSNKRTKIGTKETKTGAKMDKNTLLGKPTLLGE
jgi:hypothetical protein